MNARFRLALLRAAVSRDPRKYLRGTVEFKFSPAAETLTRAIVDEAIRERMASRGESREAPNGH